MLDYTINPEPSLTKQKKRKGVAWDERVVLT